MPNSAMPNKLLVRESLKGETVSEKPDATGLRTLMDAEDDLRWLVTAMSVFE